uniref:Uncharacterized protein n=1 Tax=Anguilla anguilla TaxID=7936 RepID=A0A0E9UCB8_ANGAN
MSGVRDCCNIQSLRMLQCYYTLNDVQV